MTELDRLQICFQKYHHFFISTEIKPTRINHNEPLQSWLTTRPPIPQCIMKSYLIIRDCLDKSFKEVFHKYFRTGPGPFRCWTLHFNDERRDKWCSPSPQTPSVLCGQRQEDLQWSVWFYRWTDIVSNRKSL